jgi:hypothetical protein
MEAAVPARSPRATAEPSCVAFDAVEAVPAGGGERFLQERLSSIGLCRRALKQGANPFELRGSDQEREPKVGGELDGLREVAVGLVVTTEGKRTMAWPDSWTPLQ